MAAMPDDGGYYLVGTDGGVFTFGDAAFRGDLGGGLGGNSHDIIPVAGITLATDGVGYWLLDPDGFNYSFTNPPDPSPSPTAAAIVATAASQVNADPDTGYFCNPYGPCEAWCALFATWVWEQAGVPIPSYAFTGDIYYWAAEPHRGAAARPRRPCRGTPSSTAPGRGRPPRRSTSAWWPRCGRTAPS